jgi:hypothetical protein
MLRLILISATLFFIFMGLRYPTVFLDVMIFNVVFIFINAYLSYKLVSKLIPPKFTHEERKLYNRYFSRYMKPDEYRKLIDHCRRRVYRVNSEIVQQGNSFSSLFFVVDASDDSVKLDLRMGEKLIRSVSLYGWVGIIEYVDLISRLTISESLENYDTGTWGVGMHVKFNPTDVSEESQSLSSEEDFEMDSSNVGKELIIYEWDLEVLILN